MYRFLSQISLITLVSTIGLLDGGIVVKNSKSRKRLDVLGVEGGVQPNYEGL